MGEACFHFEKMPINLHSIVEKLEQTMSHFPRFSTLEQSFCEEYRLKQNGKNRNYQPLKQRGPKNKFDSRLRHRFPEMEKSGCFDEKKKTDAHKNRRARVLAKALLQNFVQGSAESLEKFDDFG